MSQWSEMYPYTEANVQRYAPLTGGVYRLIHKSGDNYYVFYVGQSDNIQGRLLEHLSASEPNACIRRHLQGYSCFFRFIEVSSSQERSRIEQEQIRQFSPTCNK